MPCPEPADVVVVTEVFAVVVEPEEPVVLLAVGRQGPSGPRGPEGTPAELPTDPLAYYVLSRS